jgi:hypothetical protein
MHIHRSSPTLQKEDIAVHWFFSGWQYQQQKSGQFADSGDHIPDWLNLEVPALEPECD